MDKIESVHCALNFSLFGIFFYIDLFLKVTHIWKKLGKLLYCQSFFFSKLIFVSIEQFKGISPIGENLQWDVAMGILK